MYGGNSDRTVQTNKLVCFPEKSLTQFEVIPGKLAIASATRNPEKPKRNLDSRVHGNDKKGRDCAKEFLGQHTSRILHAERKSQ